MTFKNVTDLFRDAFDGWNRINAPRLGAALAFYTVLSVAPLLVICVAIVGLVVGATAAEGRVFDQVRNLVGPQGEQVMRSLILNSSKSSGVIAGAVGIITLGFGASGMLVELQDSLNLVWGVPSPSAGLRSLVQSRFFSFAMILGIGVLLLASLLLSAAIAAAGKWFAPYLPTSEWLLDLANFGVSWLVATFLFAAVYKTVPSTRIEWWDVWVGAAVTSTLFSIGKLLIGFYIGKAGVGSAYGAAASLVIFLVWVYYSAQVFFLGAEFTRVYAEKHGSRTRSRRPAPPPVPQPASSPAKLR